MLCRHSNKMAASIVKVSQYLTFNSTCKTLFQLLVDETTQSVKGDMSLDMLLCGFILQKVTSTFLSAKLSQCLVVP